MFLERIDIVNFRGIARLSIRLDETTILVGENNTGKSTVLEALKICLSHSLTRRGGIFSEYDHHLPDKNSQPVESEAIEIILRFAEQSVGEWQDGLIQSIAKIVQVGDDDLQRVVLRVRSQYDDVTRDFVTNWDFLDLAGNELVNAKNPSNITALREVAPVFYLRALREVAQEFHPRSKFWGPFVRSLKIDPELRQELENELAQLNERVLGANESFDTITERLGKTGKIVPLDSDDPVGIEALPSKIFDILSRTQVMLTSVNGARLPISRHGEGTQSLAVICLFDAFIQAKIKDTYKEFTSPILALEEPEAHLHPSATQAAAKLLQNLHGQKVIATHSGDLISEFELSSLRFLRRKKGVISIHQIKQDGNLSENDIRKFEYHVRPTQGSLLFARCWLLVEGPTDRFVFKEIATICGYDLMSEGISLVEFARVGAETFIQFADQLGIEWMVVADNDQAGCEYLKGAKKHIGNRQTGCHLNQLAHGDIEVFLCMEGYGHVYEQNISKQKSHDITAHKPTLAYWSQVTKAQSGNAKLANVTTVIEKIKSAGKDGVPIQLRRILECAVTLARKNK